MTPLWNSLSSQIDDNARRRIEKICDETGQSIPVVIAQLGLAPDDVVVSAFEEAFKLVRVSLEQLSDQSILGETLNPSFLKTRRILLFKNGADVPGLAMVNPLDGDAIEGITFATEEQEVKGDKNFHDLLSICNMTSYKEKKLSKICQTKKVTCLRLLQVRAAQKMTPIFGVVHTTGQASRI